MTSARKFKSNLLARYIHSANGSLSLFQDERLTRDVVKSLLELWNEHVEVPDGCSIEPILTNSTIVDRMVDATTNSYYEINDAYPNLTFLARVSSLSDEDLAHGISIDAERLWQEIRLKRNATPGPLKVISDGFVDRFRSAGSVESLRGTLAHQMSIEQLAGECLEDVDVYRFSHVLRLITRLPVNLSDGLAAHRRLRNLSNKSREVGRKTDRIPWVGFADSARLATIAEQCAGFCDGVSDTRFSYVMLDDPEFGNSSLLRVVPRIRLRRNNALTSARKKLASAVGCFAPMEVDQYLSAEEEVTTQAYVMAKTGSHYVVITTTLKRDDPNSALCFLGRMLELSGFVPLDKNKPYRLHTEEDKLGMQEASDKNAIGDAHEYET